MTEPTQTTPEKTNPSSAPANKENLKETAGKGSQVSPGMAPPSQKPSSNPEKNEKDEIRKNQQ